MSSETESMTLPQQLQWCMTMLHIHDLLSDAELQKVKKRFYKGKHLPYKRPFSHIAKTATSKEAK